MRNENPVFRHMRNFGMAKECEALEAAIAAEGEDFERGFGLGVATATRVAVAILEAINQEQA